MIRAIRISLPAIFLILSGVILYAQSTIVSGRVIDGETGQPVAFANVFFTPTLEGITTDFDGYFRISSEKAIDSLIVSFIGYKRYSMAVKIGSEISVSILLNSDVISLKEVVFVADENPAYPIMRKVVENKKLNDKRKLDFIEYDSYNRIEISINNMTEKWKENKMVSDILSRLDSIQVIRDDSGNRIVPIFVSENLSRYFVKHNPEYRKEIVKKSRISGVGMEDGSMLSQFTGSSFQEYNFYRNWMNILEKEFISPIADGWKLYYDFDLMDSTNIDGFDCYLIDIYPRNSEDLAFMGRMWITRDTYAIKQIDVKVQQSSNLNFIEAIQIQQVLNPTGEGPWIPYRTRVLIDIAELSDKTAGLLIKFVNSTQNQTINKERDNKFYNNPITIEEDFLVQDPVFWEENRFDSLSAEENLLFSMVDSLKDIPRIKTTAEIVKMISTGYLGLGKLDIGPVLYTYSYNDIEGHRIRIGLKTNEYLSKKITLRAYAAYGFKDERIKYSIVGSYILNRKRWTEIYLARRFDIDQIGLPWDELTENYFFLALTRFGTLNQPYSSEINAFQVFSEIGAGFSQKMIFMREEFSPLYNFAYYKNLNPANSEIVSDYINTSLSYELRYARDETFIINGNQRISMGIRRAPAISARYTYGMNGVFGSDFEYHRLDLKFQHKFKLGLLGVSNYTISSGTVFNPLPYPLLYSHIGNETFFYTTAAYNLMNFFEFVSDSYVSLRYQHSFEGFILNRVPLIKKLKWRLVANANILYGQTDQQNLDIIPENDQDGNEIQTFQSLGNIPYIELGYGIENIFKILRIDFFHRVTYLNKENINPFGVKISFQIIL